MKKLKDFKNNELTLNNLNSIYGASGAIVETPGGSFQGMDYDQDYFFDDDRDGSWGRGEELQLVNCTPQKA